MSQLPRTVDIIAAKRDGRVLDKRQIAAFIAGYAEGRIPDYQAAAWCMAVFLNGMNAQETAALTRAMIDSGDVMDLSGVSGALVDKHSTGGVGDKISLILAPLAAACGLKVPMMSGRALGHTGGTLDKLESIPGYSTALSPARFAECLETVGFAMIGQSEKVVPADRKMYALRDVTASVESIPLITASILSKKFAEGAESLVMDVKCGSGAFMKTPEGARELARSLVRTGDGLGRRVIAVVTDMSEPLGRKVGNFLEVEEALDALEGRGPDDVMEITLRLGAWMLAAGRLESDTAAGEERCRRVIEDGSAMERFRRNIAFQGGNPDALDALRGKSRARFSSEIYADSSGVLNRLDAFAVGSAAAVLGVGRETAADAVEPLAGIELLKKRGEAVQAGEPLMRLWAEDKGRLRAGEAALRGASAVGAGPSEITQSLIIEEITKEIID